MQQRVQEQKYPAGKRGSTPGTDVQHLPTSPQWQHGHQPVFSLTQWNSAGVEGLCSPAKHSREKERTAKLVLFCHLHCWILYIGQPYIVRHSRRCCHQCTCSQCKHAGCSISCSTLCYCCAYSDRTLLRGGSSACASQLPQSSWDAGSQQVWVLHTTHHASAISSLCACLIGKRNVYCELWDC